LTDVDVPIAVLGDKGDADECHHPVEGTDNHVGERSSKSPTLNSRSHDRASARVGSQRNWIHPLSLGSCQTRRSAATC
jgi:hypothetical protein